MTKRKQMSWQKAIDKVLNSSATPLHYAEITEQIIADGLRQDLGATPTTVVNDHLSKSIRTDGENSPYIRVSAGLYTMKERDVTESIVERKLTPEHSASDEREEQYEIITSFGMFWRKEYIQWNTRTPKLLGMQKIGATPVDFCNQLGIYLLYDGREVIYVGRTTERALGQRLYEHTADRLSARWDRFSWFGLLPVSEKGELGKLPISFDAAKLIPAFEAVIIEALEPRQNRKRGDDLASVEYLQQLIQK